MSNSKKPNKSKKNVSKRLIGIATGFSVLALVVGTIASPLLMTVQSSPTQTSQSSNTFSNPISQDQMSSIARNVVNDEALFYVTKDGTDFQALSSKVFITPSSLDVEKKTLYKPDTILSKVMISNEQSAQITDTAFLYAADVIVMLKGKDGKISSINEKFSAVLDKDKNDGKYKIAEYVTPPSSQTSNTKK